MSDINMRNSIKRLEDYRENRKRRDRRRRTLRNGQGGRRADHDAQGAHRKKPKWKSGAWSMSLGKKKKA